MVIAAIAAASPQQCRTRSKSSPAVLVEFPERATSPCSSILSHAMSDLQARRVQFEEAPEIILFLSADEGSDTVLSVVVEDEPEASQPSSPRTELPQTDETALAVPAVPPAPHDLCEGGLAELAADAWSEYGVKKASG